MWYTLFVCDYLLLIFFLCTYTSCSFCRSNNGPFLGTERSTAAAPCTPSALPRQSVRTPLRIQLRRELNLPIKNSSEFEQLDALLDRDNKKFNQSVVEKLVCDATDELCFISGYISNYVVSNLVIFCRNYTWIPWHAVITELNY